MVLFEQVALTPSGFAAGLLATTTGGSRRTTWEIAGIETRRCRQSALLLTGERKEFGKEHHSAAATLGNSYYYFPLGDTSPVE